MWQMRKERAHCLRVQGKKLVRSRALDEWVPILHGDPVPPRPRPLSPQEKLWLRDQTREWLSRGVIEPIPRQALTNNLVFVAKKDGSIRTCIDCTPANAVTEEHTWPLPRIQDIRGRITGAQWFTRLDLRNAFNRIRIPRYVRYLTAYISDGQTYQFRKMIWGLQTAPTIFQEFMDTRLQDLSHLALWYIDDILITGKTLAELRNRTRRIKLRLRTMGCDINEKKSEYEKQGLLFAGLWIYAKGHGPNFRKVREALELPPPSTKKAMQSALGLVSYLRDFIPLVAHFTHCLYPTKDSQPLPDEALKKSWGELMNHILHRLTTLGPWAETKDADLYADASGYALGVVLIQDGRIISVASRKLRPAETRYSATDREHLALVYAAEKFRIFLHRPTGTTRTWSDHAPLIGRRKDNMTPTQARWQVKINCWIPNLKHVKGIVNPADWMSRKLPNNGGGALSI